MEASVIFDGTARLGEKKLGSQFVPIVTHGGAANGMRSRKCWNCLGMSNLSFVRTRKFVQQIVGILWKYLIIWLQLMGSTSHARRTKSLAGLLTELPSHTGVYLSRSYCWFNQVLLWLKGFSVSFWMHSRHSKTPLSMITWKLLSCCDTTSQKECNIVVPKLLSSRQMHRSKTNAI